jgi:hypothetical protein
MMNGTQTVLGAINMLECDKDKKFDFLMSLCVPPSERTAYPRGYEYHRLGYTGVAYRGYCLDMNRPHRGLHAVTFTRDCHLQVHSLMNTF